MFTTERTTRRLLVTARRQAQYFDAVGTDQEEAGRPCTAEDYYRAAELLRELSDHLARLAQDGERQSINP